MKKRSHYEPSQSCVEKDITMKIDGALLKVKSIRDSDPLAGGVTSRLNLELQKVVDHNNRIGLLAAPVSKDRSLLPCFDSIKNGNALALSISQQEALKMLKPVDQFALLAAPARKMCSLISAFDSIRNSFQSAFSATQQEALKLKNLSVSVDQLALFAAPAYKNNLFLPCFDSIKNINALPFSVRKQAAFNITEMFKPFNQLALLGAPVGYHRSVLPSVDSVVDAATLADSGAFKVIRDLQQEMRDHNKSLRMLAAPVGYHRSVLPSVDSVVDAATLADSGAFKVIRDLQQEMRDYNECLGILAAPVGYHRSVLRGVDSVVDAATLAGSGAFKIARDVLQSDPILRFDGFREDVMLRPVFPLEHNRITDVPKTEHPLIRKKNCPEEEYNPNQNEMRVRLLEALDMYLETQSKERLEFCETEELEQKQEDAIQAHDRLVQWAETLERADYLLLTEDEVKGQLQENPERIGYLVQGLQMIKLRNNQLRNEPEFIEEQRRRVAYNNNSYFLDEKTDHLLNYETMRWLDSLRLSKESDILNSPTPVTKKMDFSNNQTLANNDYPVTEGRSTPEEITAALHLIDIVSEYLRSLPESERFEDHSQMCEILKKEGHVDTLFQNTDLLKNAIWKTIGLYTIARTALEYEKNQIKPFITADLIKRHVENPYLFQVPEEGTLDVAEFLKVESTEKWFMDWTQKKKVEPLLIHREKAPTADKEVKKKPHIDLSEEKEVYRIASEHKSRETWPDCVFDELFEIRKRTGETNLKVSERFCEIAGIIEQARALKKAWIDHNSSKNKKGTIQAQSRHDFGTI